MKNSILLNRLLSYSHEKQSPQRFARYAAMLIMLLTIGVGQVGADNAGINNLDGANVNMLVDGIERINMNCSNSSTSPYSATTIVCSSLILEKAYVRTWKNKSSGNICGAKIYYHIWRANAEGNYDGWQTDWTSGTTLGSNKTLEDKNDQLKQEWWNDNINVDVTEGLPEGRYVFEYNFQVTGDNGGTGGCGTTFHYNNNSQHYRIPFILKRSCTVSSEISPNVFMLDAKSGMNLYAWYNDGTDHKNANWPGASMYSPSDLFDKIGNYFVYNIKEGSIVDNIYNQATTFILNDNSSKQTSDLSINDRKGNFYNYTWCSGDKCSTVDETQKFECPVTITRTHYGPVWGDVVNMTFKLKNWSNLAGGTYTISSPDGASIIGNTGSITVSEGSATCIIKLPEGDNTPDGDVEIDFDYTVNSITFHVKAYIHVFQPKVIKVKDEVGFGGIYMKSKTLNAEDWNSWPGIKQEHLGGDWYIIRLNPHLSGFWLNNGSNSKQTYDNSGNGMYISGFSTGQICRLVTGTYGESDCYLTSDGVSGVALYRVKSYDGTNTYYSNAVELVTDTMSFYADLYNGSSTYTLQSMAADATTWSDITNINKTTFTAVYGSATATAPGNIFTAKLNGTQNGITEVAVYEGDYHIHSGATTTNYLNHGESRYGTTGTKFIYFAPNTTIFPEEPFRYYWVDWFPEGQTVIASVGNSYNDDLANVLGEDLYAPAGVTVRTGEESKYHGGNVRFGYNPKTNYFSRTIIGGSGGLIKIKGDRVNPNATGYGEEATFNDASTWVYTVSAAVKGKATATITTAYNYVDTELETDQQLIGGDADDNTTEYTVLITYDFKTNRLLAAWKPEDAFDGFDLESNLMIVRTEDGNPTVLNMVDGSDAGSDVNALTNITRIYTAIELLQDNWKNEVAPYANRPYAKRRIVTGEYIDEYYWISLPYECLVNDIFGFEGYGSDGSWVLQTYRGDLRAEKGWWAETNAWWYDLDRTDTLKANEGYVLRVTNLNGENDMTKRFAGESGGKLYLYFPSNKNNLTIAPLTGEVKTHLDSLKCTKWQKWEGDPSGKKGENNPIFDRRAVDSNWRIIGSPSFNSTTIDSPEFITESADKDGNGYIDLAEQQAAVEKYIKEHEGATPFSLKYFYNWEVVYEYGRYDTKFTIANAETEEFIGTHAHLVQYAGDIIWNAFDGSNPLVGISKAPKRQQDASNEQTLRLVLQQGTREADVAYISRMAFGATMGYDLNMDLSKMINANSANIYTMGELYKMAGNCIPDTVTVLSVGVQLAADGNYTFAMPEGTYGTGVVLVDKVANTRTNLALSDYTVTLAAGTYDERFELELSPIAQTPTDIETISDERLEISGVRKVMVDGILYIVKDGKVFDAQGNRVR